MHYESVIILIKESVKNSSVFWKDHIIQRMRERNITVSEVLLTLNEFEIIEEYKNDRPFPSYLLIGYADEKPFHIVAAVNSEDVEIHLITVYIPDSSIWENDNRRRK